MYIDLNGPKVFINTWLENLQNKYWLFWYKLLVYNKILIKYKVPFIEHVNLRSNWAAPPVYVPEGLSG